MSIEKRKKIMALFMAGTMFMVVFVVAAAFLT